MPFSVRIGTLVAVLTTLFMVSCSKNRKGGDAVQGGLQDTTSSIFLADADSFLSTWKKDDVLVNHWLGSPDNLHPTNGRLAGRTWVLGFTHHALMRIDPVILDVVPDLAEAAPEVSDDGLQYTFRLRKEALWDDGKPVTAADVHFSFKMQVCPLTQNPATKITLDNLKEVIEYPNDPHKITMVMKEQSVFNRTFMLGVFIVQKSYHDPGNVSASLTIPAMRDSTWTANPEVEALIANFNDPKYGNDIQFFNGSGAYKVTAWERGSTLVLERKPNHWTAGIENPRTFETAHVAKIIFKEIKDENAQMLELKSQELDATVWLSTATMMELEKDENFKQNYNYRYTDNFNYNYLAVNMRPDGIQHQRLFDDKEVRQALTYLVPIDDIVTVLYNNKASVWPSFLSPLKQGFNKELQPYHFDLQEGIRRLEAAGWKDTNGNQVRDKMIDGKLVEFEFELAYGASGATIDQLAQMISESFAKAGLKVNIKPLDLPALSQRISTHQFDAYMSAWATSALPEDLVQLYSLESYETGGPNFCGFGNSYTDSLLHALNRLVDDADRNPLLQELQQILYDEAPYLMYMSPNRKNVIHKRFGNQIMTFERPGNVLNHLQLLTGLQEQHME